MNNLPHLPIDNLQGLHPQWPEDLLPAIRNFLEKRAAKVVILDDDPTGTQTSRDLTVLTHWGVEAIKRELQSDAVGFFILTNSRSLPVAEACSLAQEIGRNLHRAAMETKVKLTVISRSDSTLRGHFPAEVDQVAAELGQNHLPYLLIPFFLEGGRYTLNNIHYVKEGFSLIPAAQTTFAQDASFGFRNSNLPLWVAEKTEGRIRSDRVVCVGIDDIRKGGPQLVSEILCSVEDRGACIINAASYRDMEVVVKALFEAEERGRDFLYRTAASFVRIRVGLEHSYPLLTQQQLSHGSENGGLFVIGSYVKKTSSQIDELLSGTGIQGVEIDVGELLEKNPRNKEISRVARQMNTSIAAGRDVAVYTSRKLITGENSESSLRIGQLVSDCLVQLVRELLHQPRYLVAKGGITSSDIATGGLGVQRGVVLGQVQPGVPVWKTGDETRFPGMSYIIYPGNVGENKGLADIQKMMA